MIKSIEIKKKEWRFEKKIPENAKYSKKKKNKINTMELFNCFIYNLKDQNEK